MAWEFDCVVAPSTLTEGPLWTGDSVLFTEIPADRILEYDPTTGECSTVREDTNAANGLAAGPDGALYACEGDAHRIARYHPDGTRTVVVSEYGGDRLNSPNDLTFDERGRLWFTDPDYDGKEEVLELGHYSAYRLDDLGERTTAIERVTFDTACPNGILLSEDESELFVAETDWREGGDNELRAYPICDDGTLGDHRVIHEFSPHRGVDGMCPTASGDIVATAGRERSGPGPMLYHFDPAGRVVETHPTPFDEPTNCAFGGPDLSTIYATGKYGGLYRAETDLTGALAPPESHPLAD
jgi:gluconolactonase